jgi:hypothetical protein
MRWAIGLATYVFLLGLEVLFLKGASRLKAPTPPQVSGDLYSPHPASPFPTLPEYKRPWPAAPQRAFRYALIGLVAAMVNKCASVLEAITAAVRDLL